MKTLWSFGGANCQSLAYLWGVLHLQCTVCTEMSSQFTESLCRLNNVATLMKIHTRTAQTTKLFMVCCVYCTTATVCCDLRPMALVSITQFSRVLVLKPKPFVFVFKSYCHVNGLKIATALSRRVKQSISLHFKLTQAATILGMCYFEKSSRNRCHRFADVLVKTLYCSIVEH